MKTTQEMIAVMQAYVDGKEIESANNSFTDKIWYDTIDPIWNWYENDYRVKPTSEYVPFTFEDAEFLIGKVVKSKDENWIEMITWCDNDEASSISYSTLLYGYTFIDGSPCGKLKQ